MTKYTDEEIRGGWGCTACLSGNPVIFKVIAEGEGGHAACSWECAKKLQELHGWGQAEREARAIKEAIEEIKTSLRFIEGKIGKGVKEDGRANVQG